MKRLIPVFFIFILLHACKQEQPGAGVLPEDKMIGLLTDIHIIDGYTNTISADTLNKYAPVYYHSIFKKYATSMAGFEKSLKYYSKQPERFQKMYEKVKHKLDLIQKAEEKRIKREEKKSVVMNLLVVVNEKA